jgi:predicted DNA-binding transcriptional regulator AlpA
MQMLRPAEVAQKMGVSEVTLWRLAKKDSSFPTKVKLTTNTAVWDEAEIDAYLARRIAEAKQAAPA